MGVRVPSGRETKQTQATFLGIRNTLPPRDRFVTYRVTVRGATQNSLDDRKLLFMRRFGTQMNCPATSGLAQLRNLNSYWKERTSPPMAVLGGEYPIRWS